MNIVNLILGFVIALLFIFSKVNLLQITVVLLDAVLYLPRVKVIFTSLKRKKKKPTLFHNRSFRISIGVQLVRIGVFAMRCKVIQTQATH